MAIENIEGSIVIIDNKTHTNFYQSCKGDEYNEECEEDKKPITLRKNSNGNSQYAFILREEVESHAWGKKSLEDYIEDRKALNIFYIYIHAAAITPEALDNFNKDEVSKYITTEILSGGDDNTFQNELMEDLEDWECYDGEVSLPDSGAYNKPYTEEERVILRDKDSNFKRFYERLISIYICFLPLYWLNNREIDAESKEFITKQWGFLYTYRNFRENDLLDKEPEKTAAWESLNELQKIFTGDSFNDENFRNKYKAFCEAVSKITS